VFGRKISQYFPGVKHVVERFIQMPYFKGKINVLLNQVFEFALNDVDVFGIAQIVAKWA